MTDDELSDAYRRFGAQVLLRCRRILRDDGEAEDALQDVFMKLWRYGAAFAEAHSKLVWLYRVADRCCFGRLARRRVPPATKIEDLEHAPPVEDDSQRIDDGDLVFKLLHRMEDPLRRIAVLYGSPRRYPCAPSSPRACLAARNGEKVAERKGAPMRLIPSLALLVPIPAQLTMDTSVPPPPQAPQPDAGAADAPSATADAATTGN